MWASSHFVNISGFTLFVFAAYTIILIKVVGNLIWCNVYFYSYINKLLVYQDLQKCFVICWNLARIESIRFIQTTQFLEVIWLTGILQF